MTTQLTQIAPLSWNVPITLSNGRPTPEFQRRWQELINFVSSTSTFGAIAVPAAAGLAAGTFVSMGASGLIPADPTDATKPAIGFVRSQFNNLQTALMWLPGQVNDQLKGLVVATPAKPMFLAANGGWTQALPTSGANQFIGYPISTTQMVFLPLYDQKI